MRHGRVLLLFYFPHTLAVTHCGRRETLRGEVQRLLESSQERFRASWSSLPAQKLSRNLHMPGS